MTEKTYLSYDTVHLYCDKIAKHLKETPIDIIVGITRGGLVPGVILSHLLQVPFKSVDYSTSKTYPKTINTDKFEPQETILLVDDISDTGTTMCAVRSTLTDAGLSVVTATLITKMDSKFWPTVSGFLTQDENWIVFPWETS